MRNAHLATVMVVIALGSASPARSQTAAAQPVARLVADARNALAAGRAAEAIRLADIVLARSPVNRDGTDVKIRALVSVGDIARARGEYERFVKATRNEDGGLLRPIAVGELRVAAASAGLDVRLRVAALGRLAGAGDTSAGEELQRMAVEGMGTGAGVLADAVLVKQGDDAAIRRLAEAASSDRIRDKSIVAEAVRSADARDAAFALVPLLRDESPVTRIAAADALAALRYERAIPEIRVLLSDELAPVRVRAAFALKRLGDSAGDEMVGKMLKSGVGDARLAALEASASVKPEERAAIIKAALADPEPLNRIRAAEMAAHDDPAAARAVLANLLKSSDLFVRREAARVVEAVASSDLALLRGMLADGNAWVRMYAAGGVVTATAAAARTGDRKVSR